MLHKIFTNRNFRCLVATPYQSQIELIFSRLNELIDSSPLIKREVVRATKNPFNITLKNKACILGFTTGAASGSEAASIRGQSCDSLYLDECDYMADGDFDTLLTIAAERPDITVYMSSTPTGKRSRFYDACTNKALGYKEYWYPSMCNPNWGPDMEAEFRANLTEQGYVHEVLAEFGTEETGVFNKANIDSAMSVENYIYNPLDTIEYNKCKRENNFPNDYNYIYPQKAPFNLFRCAGVDFDKYQASSSIIVLDYIPEIQMFKVIKRYDLPRSEYSYDNVFNMIIQMNEQYNPAWIYQDRGSGEYILERLHLHGKEHPSSMLDKKVKGFQFANVLNIIDPVTKKTTREPMKPFMVNQLSIAFERNRMIMSPYDKVLYKQLVDYSVVRIGKNGPVYSDTNEHFVDALGLAYLAFVMEFTELVNTIKRIELGSKVAHISDNRVNSSVSKMIDKIKNPFANKNVLNERNDDDDLDGDKPPNIIIHTGTSSMKINVNSQWGNRNIYNSRKMGRSMW